MPEYVRPIPRERQFRVAVLDFDGTLSLIRSGWVEIMVDQMLEILIPLPGTTESRLDLKSSITEAILNLNGRPTIYQMDILVNEAVQRGGTPKSAAEYTNQYLDALLDKANQRIHALKSGELTADDLLVPGARMMLEDLISQGVKLTLASGTALINLRHEAALLGIDHYFEGRIFGPTENPRQFSKLEVMQNVLAESGSTGSELLGVGDGSVEIENVKQLGGVAVGCATDEVHRSGRVEEWKRTRLIQAGADVILADYRNWPTLSKELFA